MAKNRRARRRELMKRKKRPHISAHAKPSPARVRKALAKVKHAPPVVIDSGLDWYVIQTYPGYESRVEQRIAEAKIGETYRPRETVRRGRRGKVWTTTRHLMPRHMFVGIEKRSDPRLVLADVQGLYDVLRFNGRDVRIASSELSRFAEVVHSTVGPVGGAGLNTFAEGDIVEITTGPFSQFSAVILKIGNNGMATIEVSIFGRKQEISQPLDGLLAA